MFPIALVLVLAGYCFFPASDGLAKEEDLPMSVPIFWSPEQPKQGDVVLISMNLPDGSKIKKGDIQSKEMHFFPHPEQSGQWHALYGIDGDQPPGELTLRVRILMPGQDVEQERTATMEILSKKFDEEHLTLPDSMVHLSPESLKRVRRDQAAISSLWPQETAVRYWRGGFILPVEGRPGSPFGLRRWINKEPRNFHTGMDIKAPDGTTVLASNHGRVALVGDFFFSGQSVFIDHGQGLYTMYFHLSKVRVQQGDKVRKGEIIGWVGKTGRATGPHLHWGVRLGRSRVDPEALISCTGDLFSKAATP